MAKGKKNGQKRILNEIKSQLLLQAKRWGFEDYTPLKLEEMVRDECKKIKCDLLAEKSNLMYEANFAETDKRENRIKIERLESYLAKADRAIERHEKAIGRLLDRMFGDKSVLEKVKNIIGKKSKVSVLIGE